MKTKTINIYSFDELSNEAKEKALNDYCNTGDYYWGHENKSSLNRFAEIFPIDIFNFSYGGWGSPDINWEFTGSDSLRQLTGIRLMKYIWNNYKDYIFKGKYYSLWSKTDINPHYTKGRNAPEGKLKTRYSKIIIEKCCPFTGYCMDDSLLKFIYQFLDKPQDNIDFEQLISDCLQNFIHDCNDDFNYQFSLEAYAEHCEANDYEFDEYGNMI